MRIAICTNDQEMVYRISKLLVFVANHMMITVNIDCFDNPDDLVSKIANNQYELIYLDLQINGDDFLTFGERIRERDKQLFIIYISRGKRYIEEVVEQNLVAFINYPVREEIFEQSFRKVCETMQRNNKVFEYKSYRKMVGERIQDIMFFESEGRIIHIHLKDGRMNMFYDKLDHVEEIINKKLGCDCFLRKHKSYLVNYNYIYRSTKKEMTLLDGQKLPISRTYQN
ncbi:MAG: LytTR family DNA-binding domain-containing protein [Lachnospiraceae bacterium]|nr:LytTR family DNA-binding domain-containing protein [Lachnospiraceae bacterium]